MLAKYTNNERGITRLMVATMLIACLAVAGLIAYATFSTERGEQPFYSGLTGDQALELKDAVIARGNGNTVNRINFSVAIPEGAEPVSFAAPPDNVIVISYDGATRYVDGLNWVAEEYGPGNGNNILEAGEKFRLDIAIPNAQPEELLSIEIRTPDGKILPIQRVLPAELQMVMNLR